MTHQYRICRTSTGASVYAGSPDNPIVAGYAPQEGVNFWFRGRDCISQDPSTAPGAQELTGGDPDRAAAAIAALPDFTGSMKLETKYAVQMSRALAEIAGHERAARAFDTAVARVEQAIGPNSAHDTRRLGSTFRSSAHFHHKIADKRCAAPTRDDRDELPRGELDGPVRDGMDDGSRRPGPAPARNSPIVRNDGPEL